MIWRWTHDNMGHVITTRDPYQMAAKVLKLPMSIVRRWLAFTSQPDDSTSFTALSATAKTIITYALGEHDPGHLMMGEHQSKCRALSSTTLNFSGVCLLSIIWDCRSWSLKVPGKILWSERYKCLTWIRLKLVPISSIHEFFISIYWNMSHWDVSAWLELDLRWCP